MLFCSMSLNSEDLIAPAVDVFKKRVNEQTVLVGTVKRALLSNLESAITSNLTSDTYFSRKWKIEIETPSIVYLS